MPVPTTTASPLTWERPFMSDLDRGPSKSDGVGVREHEAPVSMMIGSSEEMEER